MTGGVEHSPGLGVDELIVGVPEPVVPAPEEIRAIAAAFDRADKQPAI